MTKKFLIATFWWKTWWKTPVIDSFCLSWPSQRDHGKWNGHEWNVHCWWRIRRKLLKAAMHPAPASWGSNPSCRTRWYFCSSSGYLTSTAGDCISEATLEKTRTNHPLPPKYGRTFLMRACVECKIRYFKPGDVKDRWNTMPVQLGSKTCPSRHLHWGLASTQKTSWACSRIQKCLHLALVIVHFFVHRLAPIIDKISS